MFGLGISGRRLDWTCRTMVLRAALSVGFGFAILSPWALAQTPTVPSTVKIIVGFAAGGASDLTARLLAERMKDSLPGTTFVVENRLGASGKIASEAMRTATPDGSVLLLAPLVTPVLSQLLFKNPGFDPAKDFAPVGMVAHFHFGLAVRADHPAKTVQELIAWCKANPKQANFGTPSPGSLPHFFGVMIGRETGVPLEHIAYKGGVPMMNDLMGGNLPIGVDVIPEMVEQHKSGRIRVLAVMSDKRVDVLPDVPTMAEAGFPQATGSAWYSLWVTAKTPRPVIDALNKALNAALLNPVVKDRMAKWGNDVAPGSPEDLERRRLADLAKWRPIVEASGFKADQ